MIRHWKMTLKRTKLKKHHGTISMLRIETKKKKKKETSKHINTGYAACLLHTVTSFELWDTQFTKLTTNQVTKYNIQFKHQKEGRF